MSTSTTPVPLVFGDYALEDRYRLEKGRVYLTGIQALVRLPMMQRQRDLKAGLNTGGFISGYRGSPLGMYDNALWSAKRYLKENNIHFQPGINEDLAATAVWGTQQTNLFPNATVDGVFSIWYGKGPGVDRSMDVLKHGNAAGTSPHGGVIALAGDDHGCQSSTLPHQSEQVFAAAMIPVINPATVQEYLDFGILGFALSRYSGCWIGFKAISETVESGASVWIDPERVQVVLPTDFQLPPGGLGIRNPDAPLEQEKRLHGPKMAAVRAFARVNGFDRMVIDPPRARIGIMTTGKAYLDTRQALEDLGITDERAKALGIRLYKVGMTWPLEPEGARRFAEGLEEVIVVEEKRSNLEDQLVRILYNLPADRRPLVVGKADETGRIILPSEGELSPTGVALVIANRLMKHMGESPELKQRLARLEAKEKLLNAPPPKVARTPFFCSGCPHNTSTRVPEGSRAMAGIGCHGMAVWMPDRRTSIISHMGGEGVCWVGQAPFTSEKHIFQNLGDGTYYHSGLLAIRQAAAAGVNITFKILYNDAVAMTGGQPHDGPLTVPEITRQVEAEGAKRIVVVTDEPDKYPPNAGFAHGVSIRHRDDLDAVQRELREIPGLTVLVYDQTCAAEKRRRRKRGTFPDPAKRVFINDAVCEGCGDCSDKSNCVSVKPLETELGRKRQIDQSNCNKDFSCLKGFCPSFVSVHGGTPAKARQRPQLKAVQDDPFAALPMPTMRPLSEAYGILVTGIGGTGVITVGALIGMAAHLEGKGCTVLDFTGLAQKNGAVMSHVRLAPKPEDLHAVRIAAGGANLVLGCDMVVAASPAALSRIEPGVTKAVINGYMQPVAAFVLNGDMDLGADSMMKAIRDAAGDEATSFVDGTGLATALLGDSIATNLFMLGYAWQKGLVPLSLEALMRAIELNGVAIETSKRTFAWGRLAAHNLGAVQAAAKPTLRVEKPVARTLAEIVAKRVELLTAYQNKAYAERYRAFVEKVAKVEKDKAKGRSGLAEAVAKSLYKLMAYKDEYEVARLYTDGEFLKKLRAQFEGDYRLSFHLAPPLFAERDASGQLKKREYGPWMLSAFRLLASLKGLRGTRFDLFGGTEERRMERRLIEEYEATIDSVLATLDQNNHALAVQIAQVPESMRGFGHVKEKNVKAAKTREASLLAAYRAPATAQMAAE
ncbi:indolepyruvate ferredoxin oxidoreductase [Enhydrobacter aerosaccus]|uniref:Indolepyruvate ferredoxin oxidoreductase n=1 Tax=Enhydrobacter aerosaccus TaxID=225324 RepID=A0A1T4PEJ5_9HYPH|nr:indolepyruvate ferredoxin oxidoreductase family protein [Enhydrobacter aerosaccus]SJZ89985.1 indolepyruvate ferredoxin oxidoreductase [Enhydrobacter aerosaccus]